MVASLITTIIVDWERKDDRTSTWTGSILEESEALPLPAVNHGVGICHAGNYPRYGDTIDLAPFCY